MTAPKKQAAAVVAPNSKQDSSVKKKLPTKEEPSTKQQQTQSSTATSCTAEPLSKGNKQSDSTSGMKQRDSETFIEQKQTMPIESPSDSEEEGDEQNYYESSSQDQTQPAKGGSKYNLPEGLSKTQKKNLRKKLRDKEKKAEEAAGIRTGVPQLPEDPFKTERLELIETVSKTLGSLPSLSKLSSSLILERFREQQDTLQGLLTAIVDAQEKIFSKMKKPTNRKLPSSELLARLRQLSALPERDDVAIDYLEEQLALAVIWENSKKFQTQLNQLRQKIEDRQKLNQKCYDSARASEKQARLVERIHNLHKLQPDGISNLSDMASTKIVTVDVDVNPDCLIVMLPPTNIARRMEKIFAVAVDRSLERTRQRTFSVSGLEKDVVEAVAFLNQADFSGGCKISVDVKLIPQIIGKGGAGIREREEKFKCFIQTRESNEVVIYGSRNNAAKVIEHISSMKVERNVPDQIVKTVPIEHVAIARSLTTAFWSIVHEIEVKHSVTCRITFGTGGSNSNTNAASSSSKFGVDLSNEPLVKNHNNVQALHESKQQEQFTTGLVTVRGAVKDEVDAAVKAIGMFVSTLKVIMIPATNEALKRLFARVNFNGEAEIGRGGSRASSGRSQLTLAEQFHDLVALNLGVVGFVRHGASLAVIGTVDATSKIIDHAKQLVTSAGYTTAKITILAQQQSIFTPDRLVEIGNTSGARLSARYSREKESAHIEILGSEQEKATAAQIVKKIIDDEGAVENVKLSNNETVSYLVRQNCAKLHSIEEEFGVRLFLNRQELSCCILGNPSGIAACVAELKRIDERNGHLETVTVSIPSTDVLARLIGTKGSMINQINALSKVESIELNKQSLIATIRGTTEACADAENRMKKIFAANTSDKHHALGTETFSPNNKAQTVIATTTTSQNFESPGWGESVSANGDATLSAGQQLHLSKKWGGDAAAVYSASDASDAFPTLEDVGAAGKLSKRKSFRKRIENQSASWYIKSEISKEANDEDDQSKVVDSIIPEEAVYDEVADETPLDDPYKGEDAYEAYVVNDKEIDYEAVIDEISYDKDAFDDEDVAASELPNDTPEAAAYDEEVACDKEILYGEEIAE